MRNLRIVVLSGAALLLGSWNLISLSTGSETIQPSSGPVLEPELVLGREVQPDANPDLGVVDSHPGSGQDVRDGQATIPGIGQTPVGNGVEVGVLHQHVEERPEGAFGLILDHAFGPDRFMREPGDEASRTSRIPETGIAGRDVDERMQPGAGVPASRGPEKAAASREADAQDARPRPLTEKACYEDFLALAQKDVEGLKHEAAAVLRENGEKCRKVAMLHVLYDTDRSRALDYFVQAITYLPDRSQPEGVSVSAFAVGFLAKRVADPAVKGMVERIAWTGYLNVSPDLRRQAADALLATASPTDLQRYASFPGYQELVAASAVAGSDGSR